MREHTPRRGDLVWDERRKRSGLQPNGRIETVHRSWGKVESVVVLFYDAKRTMQSRQEYSADELNGFYVNERMGYIIYDEGETSDVE